MLEKKRRNEFAYRGSRLKKKRVQQVTEKNSMFVHVLVWDIRYTGHFFEKLLSGLFDVTSYLEYILIVIPPRIILSEPIYIYIHRRIDRWISQGLIQGRRSLSLCYCSRRFRTPDDQDPVEFWERPSLVPVYLHERSFSEKTKAENSPRGVSFFLSELFILIVYLTILRSEN